MTFRRMNNKAGWQTHIRAWMIGEREMGKWMSLGSDRNSLKAIRHNMHRKLASKLNEKRSACMCVFFFFFLLCSGRAVANRKGCVYIWYIFISPFVTTSIHCYLVHTKALTVSRHCFFSLYPIYLWISDAAIRPLLLLVFFFYFFFLSQAFIKC